MDAAVQQESGPPARHLARVRWFRFCVGERALESEASLNLPPLFVCTPRSSPPRSSFPTTLSRLRLPHAKFYAANVLSVLSYMNEGGILYRDLKVSLSPKSTSEWKQAQTQPWPGLVVSPKSKPE